jgi:hypothetical protein
MDEFVGGVAVVLGVIVLVFGLALLFAFPTMWAVNYLFSASFLTFVFGVAKINFWRALVLNFIVGYLVGRKVFGPLADGSPESN